ncbi:hypothetical protein AB4254_12240 [Vibrio breoganii]
MSLELDKELGEIFEKSESEGKLVFNLIKSQRKLFEKYGQEAVEEVLADLYYFYEDSSNDKLRCYLLNKHAKVNKLDLVADLAAEYEANGLLVMYEKDESRKGTLVKVVSPNQSSNSEEYPIQVSHLNTEFGATYHAHYRTPHSAVKEESLVSLLRADGEQFELFAEAIVESEARFQSKLKLRSRNEEPSM